MTTIIFKVLLNRQIDLPWQGACNSCQNQRAYLQKFMLAFSWYRRLVPNFASIAIFLHLLNSITTNFCLDSSKVLLVGLGKGCQLHKPNNRPISSLNISTETTIENGCNRPAIFSLIFCSHFCAYLNDIFLRNSLPIIAHSSFHSSFGMTKIKHCDLETVLRIVASSDQRPTFDLRSGQLVAVDTWRTKCTANVICKFILAPFFPCNSLQPIAMQFIVQIDCVYLITINLNVHFNIDRSMYV